MNKAAALVLAALVAVAAPAVARPIDQVTASGSLRVAVYRDFPPFSYLRDGAPAGVDVELAAAVAKRLGVAVDYMQLTAGEAVDDDLRNAVWKGHYLGGGVADLMMHVPIDKQLALRNDNAVLFGPYYREQVVVLVDPNQTNGADLNAAFADHKVGVELDSLPDYYLLGAFGGALRDSVVHYPSVAEAVAAVARGDVAGVVAPRSQIEAALGGSHGRYRVGPMPMPGVAMTAWPIGMAVKVNSHDLANAVEAAVDAMVKDGSVAALFAKHGLTYAPMTVE